MLAVIKNNEKKLWILLKTKKNHYKQYFVYKSIEVQKKWKLNLQRKANISKLSWLIYYLNHLSLDNNLMLV
jgi:hypothetical protein